MKRAFSTLLSFAVLAVLVSASDVAAQKRTTIAFSIAGSNNPFFVGLTHGMRDYAQDHKAELLVRSAEFDLAKQLADIEDFVLQGFDALIVEPLDSKAIKPAIEKAVRARIPVIAVDITAEGGVKAEILSDNVKIGNLAGQWVVEKLPNGGNVMIIAGGPTSSSLDRVAGFKQAIGKHPKIKIVSDQASFKWDMGEAMAFAETAMQANPNLDYIFCANDVMALGAHAAVVAARRKTGIVGVNAADDAIAALRGSPNFVATVAQYPNLMGALAVKRTLEIVAGKQVPFHTDVKVELITKENVARYPTWWGKLDWSKLE
jgi:ribose transport system substrate-binding protein